MAADPKAILEKLLTSLGFEATVNKNDLDGQVFLRNVPATLKPGDFAEATIEDADAHDLFGVITPALKWRSDRADRKAL